MSYSPHSHHHHHQNHWNNPRSLCSQQWTKKYIWSRKAQGEPFLQHSSIHSIISVKRCRCQALYDWARATDVKKSVTSITEQVCTSVVERGRNMWTINLQTDDTIWESDGYKGSNEQQNRSTLPTETQSHLVWPSTVMQTQYYRTSKGTWRQDMPTPQLASKNPSA